MGSSILYGETLQLPDPFHLHSYFETITLKTRQNEADNKGLIFDNHFMSYSDLNCRANAMARVIRDRLLGKHVTLEGNGKVDIDRHSIIAIDIEPCTELLVALMAVLKLGCAYLPVDSQSAINRVKYILNESQPLCIIVDSNSAFKKETGTVWSKYLLLDINEMLDVARVEGISDRNISMTELLGVGSLLALIYTSGSTGMPKGVRLCHRTAMNRIFWQWNAFSFQEQDVGCFKTSLLFIDSVVEIFSCVLNLVPLVVTPKNLVSNPESFVELLEQHHVTRLTVVPSFLHSLLFYITVSGGQSRLPDLNTWISNSETLPISLLTKFFNLYPNGKTFLNLYGSTETMADATAEVYNGSYDTQLKPHEGYLSIGRPLCNCNVYIMDENACIVEPGELGQICVSGFNVAAGYVSKSNNREFMANPFVDNEDHYIFYKTGDFGRMVNGRIIYEGRRDLQIKIRGQRVNIMEIERVILECPLVDEVVILCHRFSDISSVIVAYYVASVKPQRQQRIHSILLDSCKKSLPSYMVPKLVKVNEIPLQPHTGKIDRQALKKKYEKVYNRQSSLELAVLDEKGRKALNIIALNLSIPRNALSRDSSFFELGGNSVSMISTIVQLKEYNLHIPIEVFSKASTIQDIIDQVTESEEPISQALTTDKYIIRPLHEVAGKQKIVDILADSFIEKEPLDVLLGITKPEFMTFAMSLYKEACKSDLSLIVLDSKTGEIVGGDFLFDFFQGLEVEHHESMAPILSLFHKFEKPVYDQLRKEDPGRLMFNFCLCVHKDLPHADQVQMCHHIEAHVLETAEQNHFAGVVTNNTNPATQNICEHFFNYKLLSQYLVRDFSFNGRHVFSHAPEDYYIKMMIRYLHK